MSKYTKRIKKFAKHPRNAIVLGTAFGSLDGYLETFFTVFIFSTSTERIKNKKIVYRERIESLQQVDDVDVVFIDEEYFNEITNLTPVLRKYKPVIFLQGSTFTDKNLKKFFNSEGYDILELIKQCSIWKTK